MLAGLSGESRAVAVAVAVFTVLSSVVSLCLLATHWMSRLL